MSDLCARSLAPFTISKTPVVTPHTTEIMPKTIFPAPIDLIFLYNFSSILILISERLCREDAMRNSRRRFLICNQGDLFSLRNKSPCENMLSSIFFAFSSFRRHFNAGGIASQILFGSAIKSDFVAPAAQSAV